jgi:hypothetical protein
MLNNARITGESLRVCCNQASPSDYSVLVRCITSAVLQLEAALPRSIGPYFLQIKLPRLTFWSRNSVEDSSQGEVLLLRIWGLFPSSPWLFEPSGYALHDCARLRVNNHSYLERSQGKVALICFHQHTIGEKDVGVAKAMFGSVRRTLSIHLGIPSCGESRVRVRVVSRTGLTSRESL